MSTLREILDYDTESNPQADDYVLLQRMGGGLYMKLPLGSLPPFLRGEKGDKGDKGDLGDPGPQGVTGDQGVQGPPGSTADFTARRVIIVSKGTAATDTRGGLSPYDAGFPFATISAANTAAVSGDLIVVEPGAYTFSQAASVMKNGVNWYFHKGAEIVISVDTGGFGNPAMWKAGNGVSYGIYGHGRFVNSHASGVVFSTSAGSNVEIHGTIESGSFGISTSGRVKFVGEIISSNRGVNIANAATTDVILTGRIKSASGFSPILFAGSSNSPKCRLENVALISTDGTTASVAATAGTPSVKVYQAVANTALGAGVTAAVGAVLVDAAVE